MGKLVVNAFVTADGVMQAPGASDEDIEGGFEYGGWQMPLLDDEQGQVVLEAMARTDALLLGRKTYDIFAGYWPNQPEDNPIASMLNNMTKYVASRTIDSAEWQNTTVLSGDLATEVNRLKDSYGEVHTTGSTDLIQSLLREDLVDEINLWLYPVVLGSGKRLFGDGTIPAALELVESRVFQAGTVLLTYRRTGDVQYASAG